MIILATKTEIASLSSIWIYMTKLNNNVLIFCIMLETWYNVSIATCGEKKDLVEDCQCRRYQ